MSERVSRTSKKLTPHRQTGAIPRGRSGKNLKTQKMSAVKAGTGKAGRTSKTKSSKTTKPPKGPKGKTTRIQRAAGKTRAMPRVPSNQAELESITPFKKGVSLGVKFAVFTAVVVGFFMLLQGYLTYVITAREMDEQITQQGISIVRTLEKTIDRGFWVMRLDAGADEDQPVREPIPREELIADWEQRLKELHDADEQILTVAVVEKDPAGGRQSMIVKYPPGDMLVDGQAKLDSPDPEVQVYEGKVGDERVRRFDKDIELKLLDTQQQIVKGVESLFRLEEQHPYAPEMGEDPPEALQELIGELQTLTGRKDLRSAEDFEQWLNERGTLTRRDDGRGQIPSVAVFVKASRLDALKSKVWGQMMLVTACGGLAGILLTVLISAVLTNPVRELEMDITEVAQGNLGHQSRVKTRDETGALAHVFNIMSRNLRTAQQNAVERQAFERELNIAAEIQEKLLPERIPAIPGFDIFSHYNSAKEVGGDYYDFIVIDQTHLGIIVADVAGKGIPGAMIMTMARSLMRLASVRNISPADTFKKVNRILAKDIRRGMFVTAAYMVLNVKTRKLRLASAGHNPTVLYRARTGENELLKPAGIALGFDKGTIFDNHVQELEVQLEDGDRVVTYTDGVNEAMNNDSEEFGDDRFYDLVKSHAHKSSKEFVEAIVAALEQHRGAAEQSDDITITTLGVTPPGPAEGGS